MATKGGGLLGRADSMLVQGAFRSEMANVGRDMGSVYAMQAENVGNLQTAIQDIFYATNKSNNDLYNDVKEKSSLILADIESGTFSDDGSIDLYTNAINDLRNKMKSIPRGKEGEAERAKVRAQLAKMKADTALGEGVITEIATLLKNDQVNMPASTDAMVVFQSILDDKAKREIINGELVYSTKNAQGNIIKLNHNELNKKFIKKDYATESGALKVSSNFSKTGLQGGEYDFNGAVNLYESKMTTENGVLHLINKPFGSMKISFVEALKGGDPKLVGEMIGALNSIGGFDVEGDSRPDKITQANISKLVSTLTNQNDENFNLATTKRVAAAFYADNDGRAQHQKGLDIFNAKQPKTPGQTENNTFSSIATSKGQVKLSAGNYIDANILDSFATKIKNRDPFDYGSDGKYYWDGDSYVFEKGNKTQKIAKKGLLKGLTNTENFDVRFMESTAYKNIEDWYNPSGFNENRQLGADLNFNISNLNADDSVVRDNLNSMIPDAGSNGNRDGLFFRLTKQTGETNPFVGMSDFTEDAIELVYPNGRVAVNPQTNEPIKIMTDMQDTGAQEKELQTLKKHLIDIGLYNSLSPLN
tara:strand:- start:534 stop:2300 length:1767 start_codon:yes stop_codon:yes gene_type:complete